MKTKLFLLVASICFFKTPAQNLTLVTGKKIYDHHSSSLSGGNYGDFNVNTQSGYDFVNNVNVPSGTATQAFDRDILEHNGYYGWNGNNWGIKFGFTNNVSNISGYAGNNQTVFYLNTSITFSTLNTVNDLVSAYNSALANSEDTAVAVGNIYISKIRNTNLYVAMRITNVSNLTSAQVVALDNNQPLIADVFFEFEYKYGTLLSTGLNAISSASDLNNVIVYPNPSAGVLYLSSTKKFNSYKIINVLGEQVLHGSTNLTNDGAIDINSLDSGVYFLELLSNKSVLQLSKFIKE